jgi:superfamily II DNA/RNA helicase
MRWVPWFCIGFVFLNLLFSIIFEFIKLNNPQSSQSVIQQLLTLMNIGTPTRVQVAAIPAIAAGENILISACTGSGKTLAYLAPLVSNILEAYKNGVLTKNPKSTLRRGQPCTLVLTPNRELATQVGRIMDTFHEKLHSRQVKGEDGRRCRQRIDYAIVTGGNKPAAQKRALRNGADVVIATPERLLEHIAANHVDLTKVKCVVLDEADLLVVSDASFFSWFYSLLFLFCLLFLLYNIVTGNRDRILS